MGAKLYVGNLNFKTTEEALRDAFSANGRTVKSVLMPSDRETGRPRGFAFVEMGSDAEAQAAIQDMDGQELDGRPLRVNEAQERQGGGGGGGGGVAVVASAAAAAVVDTAAAAAVAAAVAGKRLNRDEDRRPERQRSSSH